MAETSSVGASRWRYPHQDLDEHPFPDGSRILRPSVLVAPPGTTNAYIGVVDSGSPITVASPGFLRRCGIDLAGEPIMVVPLNLGGRFTRIPIFQVTLDLVPPDDAHKTIEWTAPIGSMEGWRLSFGVLLGHRGWFDRFPTTIDATHTTVTLP